MTHLDIYTAYAAYCDIFRVVGWHCVLSTREEQPGITMPCEVHPGLSLPKKHQPATWLHIVDVEKFTSLHLTRLADGPPLLQKIARQNLEALHKSLTHSHTQSAHT